MACHLIALGKEMLREYSEVLSNIYLQIGVEDRWRWQLTLEKGYIVSGVYQMLTEAKPNTWSELHEIIIFLVVES